MFGFFSVMTQARKLWFNAKQCIRSNCAVHH